MIFFNLRAEKPKFHFAYQFGILLGGIHEKKKIDVPFSSTSILFLLFPNFFK